MPNISNVNLGNERNASFARQTAQINMAARNPSLPQPGSYNSSASDSMQRSELEQELSQVHDFLANLLESLSGEQAPSQTFKTGLDAYNYGVDAPAVNPNTGTTDWNGWGLGWVNQALQSQGCFMPELQTEDSQSSLAMAQANGKLQEGTPPPGSVVYFQDGDRVRMGIVGPDGSKIRVTGEPDAQGNTIHEVDLPQGVLGWMEPSGAAGPAQTPAPGGDAQPTPGVDPSDPASFYITQNQTQYNPDGSINANCGPTSLAMAALAFGKNPPGTSKDDPEGMIEAVRVLMTGEDNIQDPTNEGQVLNAAQKMGLDAHAVDSLEAANEALANGQMVVAGSSDHFILITGRTPDGGYIVNDPAYEGQPGVVRSQAQMADFYVGGVAVGT